LFEGFLPWQGLIIEALHLPNEFRAVWAGEFQVGINPYAAAQQQG
jgi:hypothetical protein